MRINFTLFFLLCVATVKSQLLSWAPQLPPKISSYNITVDAIKGNKGLMDYTGVCTSTLELPQISVGLLLTGSTSLQPRVLLHFRRFSGKRNSDNILLERVSSKEENVKNFVAERSNDGIRFNTVATVAAKKLADTRASYSYMETDPLAVNGCSKLYYRLNMTD